MQRRMKIWEKEIPGRLAEVARSHFGKSPDHSNYCLLAKGVRNALGLNPKISKEDFSLFCESVQGLQAMDNEGIRKMLPLVLNGDPGGINPIIAVHICKYALLCPKSKQTLLGDCISAILSHDYRNKFQKSPHGLLLELAKCLASDSWFLPSIILSYINKHGFLDMCCETKDYFKKALAEKILIKTEIRIGDETVGAYVKGVFNIDSLVAYAPSKNAVYAIEKIEYGDISFRTFYDGTAIYSHQFEHDDLKGAIEAAERADNRVIG